MPYRCIRSFMSGQAAP